MIYLLALMELLRGGLRFYDRRVGGIRERIEKKLEKHISMSQKLLVDEDTTTTGFVTSKRALLSRSFLNSTKISIETILESFKSLKSTEFSARVMMVNALNAIEHQRFSILFIDLETAGGAMNFRNTVRIGSESLAMEETLFHELIHKALNDVFNIPHPYVEGDMRAKDAYRESMRQVFLNYVDVILSIDELAKCDCDKVYRTDLEVQESYQVFTKQEIKFVHLWSRDMTLDELVANCFGKGGLFSHTDSFKYFAEGGSLMLDEQTVCKRDEIGRGKPSVDYIVKLGKRLDVAFTWYQVSDLDAEFITNVIQSILNCSSEDLVIIQPLLDYIEQYVNPAIDNYIASHPSRDRIDDTLQENDEEYRSQLAKAESLMLVPKQSQSGRSIILAMLMVGLAYTSWMFIKGLLSLDSDFDEIHKF